VRIAFGIGEDGMFGWRRRSEGFEWREYVRTTVLVRRADRQRKIDDARMAALAKAKDTRDRGVAAASAVADSVWRQITELVTATASALWDWIKAFAATSWSIVCAVAVALAERIPPLPRPSLPWPTLPRFEWSFPSLAKDGARAATRLLPDVGLRLPINPKLIGGGGVALALILVGGPMLRSSDSVTTARLVPAVAAPPATATLAGRASAISGDVLRVDGQLVRLAGIETPELKQPCFKSNGRHWNCAASAKAALDKIVRGNSVNCARSGQDDEGRIVATCRIDDADIAENLVRGGHVFAASGMFASYGSAESEARSATIGVWQGETARPGEWRDQIWQEAKKTSPEGCPIKGYVRASSRLYAMPWSAGYDGARVRTVRGDRWFCSEDEARSAGFKLANRS
jgi:endonuclease YncB( thermonuclease family)